MKSTGNDIVALKYVDTERTTRYRFYSKILSDSEQALYYQPQFEEMPFENYIWLLWSVKESAYKYLKRIIPGLIFSPTKFIIQNITIPGRPGVTELENNQWENTGYVDEFYSGKVIYGTEFFCFRSKINEDWVATVVNDNEHFDNVYWGVQSIDDAGYYHQSKAARTLLLNKLNFFFQDDFQIKKSPFGYPVILKGIQNMHIPASLAHDDHFVAYSFILNCGSNGRSS